MMKISHKYYIFTFLVLLLVCITSVELKTGTCYGLKCPKRTDECKKVVRSSKNKKKITTHITCSDIKGNLLKEQKNTGPNVYGGNVYMQSTKKGSFSLGNSVKSSMWSHSFF